MIVESLISATLPVPRNAVGVGHRDRILLVREVEETAHDLR